MLHKLDAAWRMATHAVALIFDSAAAVDVRMLALGTILYFIAQGVRTRGWHTILRTAYPEASDLRARDVMWAYLAGAGVNSLVPARGGDVVKLALVHKRIEGSRYATLAATFVPEALFETLFGFGLVVWALAKGFLPIPTSNGELPTLDVSLLVEHPVLASLVVAGTGVTGWLVVRFLRGQLRQGMAIFCTPRRFITGVATWQALGRLIRLGSLAAFMAAFHLPVTPATVVLVMAAQGGGRILPIAPVSAGLRMGMLSYGFVEVTGKTVDIAEITAFTFGVSAVVGLVGLVIAFSVLAREHGTRSPRALLRIARRPAPAAVPSPSGASAT
jgi:hypothetical protein